MDWCRLCDSIVHMRAAGEPSVTQELRLPQTDGGIRMHNGTSVSIFLAARLRSDITRQFASLFGRAGTVHNGFTCSERGRRTENC